METQTDKKFFVPALEDMYLGYEYEQELFNIDGTSDGWCEKVINTMNITGMPWQLEQSHIRVPYLSKEQIEVEGWVLDCQLTDISSRYTKDSMLLLHNSENHNLVLCQKSMIGMEWGKIGITDTPSVFKGQCKSINEFRKIVSYLGIK